MIIKRIVSALLLSAMLLSMVSGCGDDNDAGDVEYIYVPESIPFPILPRGLPHIGIRNSTMFYGDTVYFVAIILNPFDYYGVDDPLEFDFTWLHSGSIFSMNPDGTNLQELPDYYFEPPPHEPDSVEGLLGGVYLSALAIDHNGSLWVFEVKGVFDDDGNHIETYHVRKLSSTGAELLSLDVTAFVPGIVNEIHPSFCVDKDGYVYFLFERSIIVINSTDASSFSLSAGDHYAKRIIMLPDGNVAHYDGDRKIRVIDAMSQAWGEEIDLPPGASDAVAGNDEIPILFLIESSLMGINAETGEVVEFVNFTDRGISFNHLINLAFLSDGRIIAVTWTSGSVWKGISPYQLFLLSKIPVHEYQERTELTLFGYEIDSIVKNAVVEFNQTSKTYRIQMTDYAQFN
ncbi:MAG: hypothetical protein LBD23_11445, partial [Oscillospiraceae bacterium]|nr:hypothetical protein [Oscillospiraceae bacterium]